MGGSCAGQVNLRRLSIFVLFEIARTIPIFHKRRRPTRLRNPIGELVYLPTSDRDPQCETAKNWKKCHLLILACMPSLASVTAMNSMQELSFNGRGLEPAE